MSAAGDGHRGVVTLGRVAAGVGAVCVALPHAGAVPGGHGGPVVSALFVAMAMACLGCVRALWRDPGPGVWRSTGLMYGAMLFVHLLLLSAASGTAAHAGHAGGHGTGLGGWPAAGTWAGLLLALVQVALAGSVLTTGRTREPAGGRAHRRDVGREAWATGPARPPARRPPSRPVATRTVATRTSSPANTR